MRRSVGSSVLVEKAPLSVDGHGHEVFVRISDFIAAGPVADFQIGERTVGAVLQMMRHATGLEAGAHSRTENGLPELGDQDGFSFQSIDELILPAMPMAQR